MSCSKFKNQLHPWLRGELSDEDGAAVEQHVAGCYTCATVVEKESVILRSLSAGFDVPEASAGFEQRVLTEATRQARPPGQKTPLSVPWFGGAVAAALALGIALGLGMGSGQRAVSPVETQATMAAGQTPAQASPVTVKLAFDSAEAMADVTLTVELPAHVEVSSYPGRQRLSWKVNLDQGENILKLPLTVLFPGDGELVAHLDNGERNKTFRAPLSQIGGQTLAEPVL